MMKLDNVSAGYGPCDVIKNISTSANPGELITLLGPNGSGKSTLLKTMAGLIEPRASSSVTVNDTSLNGLSLKARARLIAYLAQERLAPEDMRVSDILELGRAPYRGRLGKISPDGRRAIERSVKNCAIEPLLDRKFGMLSGGEQARILLARALTVDGQVLLADEPVAALDPYYQLSTLNVLRSQARSGKAVIIALHDLNLAAQFADRVWLLNRGQLFADGPPKAVLTPENVESVYQVKLSDGRFSL